MQNNNIDVLARRKFERMKMFVEKRHLNPEDCTCHDCECNIDCEFAYDGYNTDDDCLANK